MTVVTNVLINEVGEPVVNAFVRISLLAPTETSAAWITNFSAQIIDSKIVRSDSNGAWSLDLIPNELITPENSVYQVIQHVPGTESDEPISYFIVPDDGDEHFLGMLLTVAPTGLPVMASQIAFTPTDGMTSTNVQDAIVEAFTSGHGGGGGESTLPRLRTVIAGDHTTDTIASGVNTPITMEIYDSVDTDGMFHLSDDGTSIVIDQDGDYAFMVNLVISATQPIEAPIAILVHGRDGGNENPSLSIGALSPGDFTVGTVSGVFVDRFVAGDTFQAIGVVAVTSGGTWSFVSSFFPVMTAVRLGGGGGSSGGIRTVIAEDEDVTVEAFNGTTVVLYTALTAARTVMLPPASGPSQIVIVKDVHGLATNDNTIDLVPADGDETDGWDPIGSVVPPFNPGIALSVVNDGDLSWSQVSDQSLTLAYVASVSIEVANNLNSLIERVGDNLVHTVNGQENDVALEPIPHANIALWFDASAEAFAGTGTVTDRSVSRRVFNGNPGTGTLNDLPVRIFDGAHTFTPVDPPSAFAALHHDATTIFIVTKYQHGGSGTYFGDLTGTSPGIAFVTDDIGLRAAMRGGLSNDVIDGHVVFDADTWQLVTVKLDPQNATPADRVAMFLDGVDALVAPNVDNNGAVLDDAGAFQIGNQPLGPGLNGSIAEILIYDAVLTDVQQKKVESYLREKWLPATNVPGVPVVRSFTVEHTAPNLDTDGVELYAPTVGEVLLDAWIEVSQAWFVEAYADIGTFDDTHGWFYAVRGGDITAGVNVGVADAPFVGATGLAIGLFPRSRSLAGSTQGFDPGVRVAPSRFISTDPVKLVVSADGSTVGGPAPDTSVGSITVYLVTTMPIRQ